VLLGTDTAAAVLRITRSSVEDYRHRRFVWPQRTRTNFFVTCGPDDLADEMLLGGGRGLLGTAGIGMHEDIRAVAEADVHLLRPDRSHWRVFQGVSVAPRPTLNQIDMREFAISCDYLKGSLESVIKAKLDTHDNGLWLVNPASKQTYATYLIGKPHANRMVKITFGVPE